MKAKVCFLTNHLTFRGSCVALYDYAHYNEILLNGTSLVATPRKDEANGGQDNNSIAWKWIANRFPIYFYDSLYELEDYLLSEEFDMVYCIKHGQMDEIEFHRIPLAVHCVFDMSAPHGTHYVGVSKSLAEKFGSTDWVSHMVSMNPVYSQNSLRKSLGVPVNAVVIGRYGGMDTFNIDWAKTVISELVRQRSDRWFLFMNTPRWDNHPQIIHLPAIANVEFKKRFIKTCDAMVVPETMGHTFGLSIAEFQVFDKPVICYNGWVWNRAHLDVMGTSGLYFSNEEELRRILNQERFESVKNRYNYYNPENVMKEFSEGFYKNLTPNK